MKVLFDIAGFKLLNEQSFSKVPYIEANSVQHETGEIHHILKKKNHEV